MKLDQLSEADISTKIIIPSVVKSGWNLNSQIREQYTLTKGRIKVFGKKTKREAPLRPDITLFDNNNGFNPIAVIEVKKADAPVGEGIQKAILYSEKLDIPFAFSTNGKEYLFHDKTDNNSETVIAIDKFPDFNFLIRKYLSWKKISNEKIYLSSMYFDRANKVPYYFQTIAINKTIQHIISGNKRCLIAMATGTGKTFVAFQVAYKLLKSRFVKRILFLADRNILIDQTKLNDFSPFGETMTKITGRKIDKSYEVYLALYQAVTGTEDFLNIYKKFSKDFFDLIIIDECHRGSANEDSQWREILNYFSKSVHLGMTATPKETEYVSNTEYFGKPIFTYSLKDGIKDGFLAPYKIIKVNLDKDKGWTPSPGMVDDYGNLIEDRQYNQRDYDRQLILSDRNREISRIVSDYIKSTDKYGKTIVFCEDKKHADRMRSKFIEENQNEYKKNNKYIVRIVSGDEVGESQIDNFKDPNSTYPVIATTSKLLSTGVDTKTCKIIVIDKNINSLTEFKQIIGRGTRVSETHQKYYFTIFDFRNTTRIFFDPEFDGNPIVKYEINEKKNLNKIQLEEDKFEKEISKSENEEEHKITKFYVSGVKVQIDSNRILYLDENNKLITDNIKEYTKNRVLNIYKTFSDFENSWKKAEIKKDITKKLIENSIYIDVLSEEKNNKLDTFDLICHYVYDKPVLTKSERVKKFKENYNFEKIDEKLSEILNYILEKYCGEGIEEIEDLNIFRLSPFSTLGTPHEIIKDIFGGINKYKIVMKDLKNRLYK